MKPIGELRNWDKNPRAIDKKDFERLKRQIKKLGQYKPLLVTKEGVVLGGNMRLRAYRELGIKEVWVSEVDAKTDEEKLAYALSDNDRVGYYVDQDLAELIINTPELNLEDYKIDLGKPTDLQDLLDKFGPEVEEDETPPLPDKAISKLGEVYTLGKHRLMCGDATKIEDVEKLMDSKKADMVFTDPPYGVDAVSKVGLSGAGAIEEGKLGKAAKYRPVIGDTSKEVFKKCWQVIKGFSAEFIIFGGNHFTDILPVNGHWLVWIKKGFDKHDNFSDAELMWTSYKLNTVKTYRYISDGMLREGSRAIEGVKRVHPTQKPVGLIVNIMKEHEGEIVLDVFGGSGSTLIAAEQTNRICYMMELDPRYCDVIRTRFDNFIQNNNKQ